MTAHARAGLDIPVVRVDVLGPLRLTVGGSVVPVPGPKRRALLALLAIDDRAVPVDDILDALWPVDLPDAARTSLQSQVSRLRGHLGRAGVRLEGLNGAYRLRLDGPGSGTDARRARSLLNAAKAAGPAEARRLLEEARSLWRGAPLGEFLDVHRLAGSAATLIEVRRRVDEAYVDATLASGDHGAALEVAMGLVSHDPLSEPAVVLLMRALAAAGRGAEALRSGYEYRRRLAEETGLEPSPALGELERTIAGQATGRQARRPRPGGPLRGRDSELAALHRLLACERLVTVVGPAGVGKTRLATELAARTEPATVLSLATVTDATAVPIELAATLDLQVVHGDVLTACARLLAAGPQLLLIDNCEHLLAGVRDVVALLLDDCPQLTVLTTSREPLGLDAEQRFRLGALSVATPVDANDLARSPAVAVFLDRARQVRPGFTPDRVDLALVAEIVRRLDGMPLAIELAAARMSSLQLGDLHARLDRALDLLGDDRTTTLRQAFEWSYALLPPDEQRLFRHLGVFPDGFDLPTAETIGADLDLSSDTTRALAHLVDASMIETAFGNDARYRMLDVMRSFALDRLHTEGEADLALERFVGWALGLAAWTARTADTEQEPAADRVLRRELANLRGAVMRQAGRGHAAGHLAHRPRRLARPHRTVGLGAGAGRRSRHRGPPGCVRGVGSGGSLRLGARGARPDGTSCSQRPRACCR